MSIVICDHCERNIGSDKDLYCFIDNEGWCEDETVCESCREGAYDRQQERLMEDGGGPSLIEQQQAAYRIKHGLRS